MQTGYRSDLFFMGLTAPLGYCSHFEHSGKPNSLREKSLDICKVTFLIWLEQDTHQQVTDQMIILFL